MEVVDGQHAASYDPPPGRCRERGCCWPAPCPEHDDGQDQGAGRRRGGLSPVPVPLKWCPRPEHRGLNPLPVSSFYANRARYDGVDAMCRVCKRRYAAARRAARRPPPALPPGRRRCPCPAHAGERVLPVTAFYMNRVRGRRESWCIACTLAASRARRARQRPVPAVTVHPPSAIALAAAPAPAPAIVVSCACGCGELLPSWPPRPGRKFIGSHRKRAARRDERRELRELKSAAAAAVPVPPPQPVPLVTSVSKPYSILATVGG